MATDIIKQPRHAAKCSAAPDADTLFSRAFSRWDSASALLVAYADAAGATQDINWPALSLARHVYDSLSAVSESDELDGLSNATLDMYNTIAVMAVVVQTASSIEEKAMAQGILMLMEQATEEVEDACSILAHNAARGVAV